MFAAELFESSRCPPTISASALKMTTIPVDSLEAMIVMPETDLGAEKWDHGTCHLRESLVRLCPVCKVIGLNGEPKTGHNSNQR
jgi:hypothetical protein